MKTEEITEQFQSMINRLSRRERLIVIAAIIVFLCLVSLMTVIRINGTINDRQSSIAYKENGLNRIVQLSAGFREAQDEQKRLESMLRGQKEVSLISHMEELARSQGISISNMTPRQAVTEGTIREDTLELSLEGVTLDKVAGLVNAIQRSPHMVKVSTIRIRRRGSSDEVQASMTVSSYSLARTG